MGHLPTNASRNRAPNRHMQWASGRRCDRKPLEGVCLASVHSTVFQVPRTFITFTMPLNLMPRERPSTARPEAIPRGRLGSGNCAAPTTQTTSAMSCVHLLPSKKHSGSKDHHTEGMQHPSAERDRIALHVRPTRVRVATTNSMLRWLGWPTHTFALQIDSYSERLACLQSG